MNVIIRGILNSALNDKLLKIMKLIIEAVNELLKCEIWLSNKN